jgi:cell filamentation protein
VTDVLDGLADDGWLTGLRQRAFLGRLAHYYGELNARHPFREGNGRAQRAFLRQLAAAAGWRLDWSALDRAGNEAACQDNVRTGRTEGLIAVLAPVVVRI